MFIHLFTIFVFYPVNLLFENQEKEQKKGPNNVDDHTTKENLDDLLVEIGEKKILVRLVRFFFFSIKLLNDLWALWLNECFA